MSHSMWLRYNGVGGIMFDTRNVFIRQPDSVITGKLTGVLNNPHEYSKKGCFYEIWLVS